MYIDEQSRRSVPLPSPEEKVVKGRGIFHPLDWWTVIFMLTAGAAVVFRGSRAEASEGQQGHLPTWLVRYAPRSNHHESQITLIVALRLTSVLSITCQQPDVQCTTTCITRRTQRAWTWPLDGNAIPGRPNN